MTTTTTTTATTTTTTGRTGRTGRATRRANRGRVVQIERVIQGAISETAIGVVMVVVMRSGRRVGIIEEKGHRRVHGHCGGHGRAARFKRVDHISRRRLMVVSGGEAGSRGGQRRVI